MPKMDIYQLKRKKAKGIGGAYSTYHRYFGGYCEYVETDKNGKKRIKRIYTGNYYSPNLTETQCVLYKLVYWFVFLASVVSYLYSATTCVYKCIDIPITVMQLLIGLGHVWLGVGLVHYSFAEKKRTKAEMTMSRQYILWSSLLTGSAFLLSAILIAVMCIWQKFCSRTELFCMFGYAAGAVLMGVLNRIEHKVTYLEIPSLETKPDDAVFL